MRISKSRWTRCARSSPPAGCGARSSSSAIGSCWTGCWPATEPRGGQSCCKPLIFHMSACEAGGRTGKMAGPFPYIRAASRPPGARMARITVEDCMEVVDNRFSLVMMAAKRARQLANGVEPQIDNAENDDKPTVLALREIAARAIDDDYIEAVDKAERERKEREALEWAAAEVVADEELAKGDDL